MALKARVLLSGEPDGCGKQRHHSQKARTKFHTERHKERQTETEREKEMKKRKEEKVGEKQRWKIGRAHV